MPVLDENGVFRSRGDGRSGRQKIRGNVRAKADRKTDVEGFKTQKTRRVRMRRVRARTVASRQAVAAQNGYERMAWAAKAEMKKPLALARGATLESRLYSVNKKIKTEQSLPVLTEK